MGEVKQELKTHQVDYVCDECQNGYMVGGQMLLSDPPKFVHTCTNDQCKNQQNFYVRYPTISYELIEEDKQGG